jgi:hypothetical protein
VCNVITNVSEYPAKEMERKPDGKYQSIALCTPCHVFHERYVNALMKIGYNPDKLKITHTEIETETKEDLLKH